MVSLSRPRTLLGWSALAIVVIAVAVGIWYSLTGNGNADRKIDTAAVDKGLIEQSVSATGSVQALITVDLSSQLSGQIADVKVDFNSKVKAGDLLAALDKKTFDAKVKSAEADLQMATAGIEVQKATILKNQALVKKARDDLARQEKLAARGAAAQSALDAARTALATAESDLTVATAQLENAKAQVAQRRSSLEQAQIDLERTDIRSPIDGVVISRQVDPGSTVAASLSAPILFQIAKDLTKVQIETAVDEADIGRIKTGNDVSFTVDAYPDRTFRGKVAQVRIGGTSENNVVTYTVIVRADNPRESLLPGMTATVRIVTGRKENVLRVPNAAVRFRPPADMPGAEKMPRWGRNEAFMELLSEKLKLTPDQRKKLKKALEELRARRVNAENAAQPRSNASDAANTKQRPAKQGDQTERKKKRSSGSGGFIKVLQGILTEEQMATFREWRKKRRETPARPWFGSRTVPASCPDASCSAFRTRRSARSPAAR
jgi:HlyD family secretion protein